jgi:four helix bundle protein
MSLDHERLDVYNVALDFLVFANEVIERLPRGRSHLCDQLTRASTSIVLNLAEGAGKHSKPDKRRYYLTARGSATESAALLDICWKLRLVDEVAHQAGKAPPPQHRLDEVAVILSRPTRSALRSQNRGDLRPSSVVELKSNHLAAPGSKPMPAWKSFPRRFRARARARARVRGPPDSRTHPSP